jgi:transcription elongation factor
MQKVTFDGTQQSVLDILAILPGDCKAIRTHGKSITIPTSRGAKDVYKGDMVTVNAGIVKVEEGGEVDC